MEPDAVVSKKLGKPFCSSAFNAKSSTWVKVDDEPNLDPKVLHRKKKSKVIYYMEVISCNIQVFPIHLPWVYYSRNMPSSKAHDPLRERLAVSQF